MALFTLLYKQLTRGDFAGFVANHALIRPDAPTEGWLWEFTAQDQVPVGWFSKGRWSDGFACPAIVATARTLAANPRDDRARLCLGDFLRINGFDGFTALDDKPPAGELGSFARDFPGTARQRDATYAGIIADPRAAPEIKAYALYRAVMCYAPSGINACGGTTVPVAQRKAWHDRLKRDYPRSPWAQKLRYYW
jgi:hypothetical protein